MPRKILLCIFDLDGVIVDTAKYHYLAWRRLGQELGFDFDEKHNERLKGVSRTRSLEILLEIGGIELTAEEKEKAASQKNTWYREYILKMDESEILPGVVEFLRELRAKGIKIALGSASKNAMTILNQVGLVEYFDEVIDGTKVTKAKPDPEGFLLAARNLNILPEHCGVFEDAKAGIEAAKRANMYAIGVGDPNILAAADQIIPGFDGKRVSDVLPGF